MREGLNYPAEYRRGGEGRRWGEGKMNSCRPSEAAQSNPKATPNHPPQHRQSTPPTPQKQPPPRRYDYTHMHMIFLQIYHNHHNGFQVLVLVQYWHLHLHCTTHNAQCRSLSINVALHGTLGQRPWTLDFGLSTLDFGLWTLDFGL